MVSKYSFEARPSLMTYQIKVSRIFKSIDVYLTPLIKLIVFVFR